MTIENQEIVKPEDNQDVDLNNQNQERQYTEDESKAMDHGWVPKDQWKGPEDEWVPAKVFNIRGELFGRIAKDKHTISELRQSVDALVEHNKKLFDAGYKKALNDLKSEKREALEQGDTSAVMRIDDEIEELRENAEKEKREFEQRVQTQRQAPPVEFMEWHENNSWYMNDGPMTAYADAIGKQLLQQTNASGKQVEWSKFYQEVGRKVRQKFPEKFETRTRQTVRNDSVENGEDSAGTKPRTNSFRESDLTEDQRRIMNTILKTTQGLTKKEYLEQMAQFEQRKNG